MLMPMARTTSTKAMTTIALVASIQKPSQTYFRTTKSTRTSKLRRPSGQRPGHHKDRKRYFYIVEKRRQVPRNQAVNSYGHLNTKSNCNCLLTTNKINKEVRKKFQHPNATSLTTRFLLLSCWPDDFYSTACIRVIVGLMLSPWKTKLSQTNMNCLNFTFLIVCFSI